MVSISRCIYVWPSLGIRRLVFSESVGWKSEFQQSGLCWLRGATLQFCIGRQKFPLWNPLIYRETKVPPFKYILNMQNSSMFLLSHILTKWIIEWWMGAATQLLTCRVSTHALPNCSRAIPRRQKAWLIFSNNARKIDNPCRRNAPLSNHPRVSSSSAVPPHQASVCPLARGGR